MPIPDFLKPVTSNPPAPALTAYLSYIYGWVPFNFACAAPDLPTANLPPDKNGKAPIDYIALQYNYETLPAKQWFNPYTQFVQGSAADGGLGANAYAFSIDDSASVQNNAGDGLIFAVGGANGLPNKTQVPPPSRPIIPITTLSLALARRPPAERHGRNTGFAARPRPRRFPTPWRLFDRRQPGTLYLSVPDNPDRHQGRIYRIRIKARRSRQSRFGRRSLVPG